MGINAIIPILTVILILSSSAYAYEWTNCDCLNKTHVFCWENIPTSSGVYTSNTTKFCQYDCNTDTDYCNEPYNINPVQANFGLPFFIFFIIAGLAGLFIGSTKKKITFTIFGTIMFCVVAMQSLAIDTIFTGTFFAGFTHLFIGFSWIMVAAGFFLTLYGAVNILMKKRNSEQKIMRYV